MNCLISTISNTLITIVINKKTNTIEQLKSRLWESRGYTVSPKNIASFTLYKISNMIGIKRRIGEK